MVRSARARAWIAAAGLLVAVCAASMILASLALERGAADLGQHWRSLGLPGDPAVASGASAPLRWPPRVAWSHVAWRGPGGFDLQCGRIEVRLRPLDLLRGKFRLAAVHVQDLVLDVPHGIGPFLDPARDALAPHGLSVPRSPDGRNEVVLDVRRATLRSADACLAIDAIEGWGSSPRRAAWELGVVLRAAAETGREPLAGRLRGAGSGAAGRSTVAMELDLGPTRTVRGEWTRQPNGTVQWRASGADDGQILGSLLREVTGDSTMTCDGRVVFWGENDGTSGAVSEVRSDSLLVGTRGSSFTLRGTVCSEPGRLAAEGLEAAWRGGDADFDFELPLGDAGGTGRFDVKLTGLQEGACEASGSIVRESASSWIAKAPVVLFAGGSVGPLELRFVEPARIGGAWPSFCRPFFMRPREGHLAIGAGRVRYHGGSGTLEDPVVLSLEQVPFTELQGLLPVDVPGTWTGTADGTARMARSDDGWRVEGTLALRDARVRDLEPLRVLQEDWGLSAGGVVNWQSAFVRYSRAPGRFLADSIAFATRDLGIQGELVLEEGERIQGVLRIEPLRLGRLAERLGIGGRGLSIDLGIAGTVDSPSVSPIGEARRLALHEHIESVRRTLRAGPSSS